MRGLRRSATVHRTPSHRRRKIIPKTVEGGRGLLNLPGHHSTAAIIAEVRINGEGMYDKWATVQISDCQRAVSLDFSVTDVDEHENNLYKIDTMLDTLKEFRRALVKAQRQFAKQQAARDAEAEAYNR